MCLRDFENLRVARISLFNRRFERLGWATSAYSLGSSRNGGQEKFTCLGSTPRYCLRVGSRVRVIPTAGSVEPAGLPSARDPDAAF